MEHRYTVYGVSVRTDIPFSFPIDDGTAATVAEVCFRRAGDEEFPAAGASGLDDGWFSCQVLEGGSIHLRWSGLFEFVVSPDGACVTYRPLKDGSVAILQNLLFGQALSFALVRQNLEPLHASVVDIGGCGIALLGDCTYGKSTFAASLLEAGCRLVSDDLLLVRHAGGHAMAHAGAARIKLYQDSADRFLGPRESVVVLPNAAKRLFPLDSPMIQRAAVPLRAFIVLPTPEERAASEGVDILRLTRAELFHELLKNTFVRHLEDGVRLHHNFAANSRLAAMVDGYRLTYPPGIDRLASIGNTLLAYLRDHSQETDNEST